jgi:hypothetical protein
MTSVTGALEYWGQQQLTLHLQYLGFARSVLNLQRFRG